MKLPKKIEIKPVATRTQIPTKVVQWSLELTKKYIRFIADFKADMPINDECLEQGFQSRHILVDNVVPKSSILGIEMHNNVNVAAGSKSQFVIAITSADGVTRIVFNSRVEAYLLYTRLLKYWQPTFVDNKFKRFLFPTDSLLKRIGQKLHICY